MPPSFHLGPPLPARALDDHDGVPERLAPSIVSLFDPLRPSAPDTGSEAQLRQRRRRRFEKAVLAPRGYAGDSAVIESLADELLALAGEADDAAVKRRAAKVRGAVKKGCLALASVAVGEMPALLRSASDVGRALLVVSVALDPELGPSLARDTGQQAAAQILKAHATRALTLAANRYAEAAG